MYYIYIYQNKNIRHNDMTTKGTQNQLNKRVGLTSYELKEFLHATKTSEELQNELLLLVKTAEKKGFIVYV